MREQLGASIATPRKIAKSSVGDGSKAFGVGGIGVGAVRGSGSSGVGASRSSGVGGVGAGRGSGVGGVGVGAVRGSGGSGVGGVGASRSSGVGAVRGSGVGGGGVGGAGSKSTGDKDEKAKGKGKRGKSAGAVVPVTEAEPVGPPLPPLPPVHQLVLARRVKSIHLLALLHEGADFKLWVLWANGGKPVPLPPKSLTGLPAKAKAVKLQIESQTCAYPISEAQVVELLALAKELVTQPTAARVRIWLAAFALSEAAIAGEEKHGSRFPPITRAFSLT